MRQRIPRRAALLLGLATVPWLAGCGGGDAPPATETFPALDYSYLPKLRLNVASVQVDDSWTPAADSGQHVEYLSPEQPLDALRDMAHTRLVAAGASGQARLVIEDASILRQDNRLDGSMAVRLDVSTGDGTRSGFAEARVARSLPESPDQSDGGRAAAYRITKQMMDDMNVELEYQVRRTLRDYLVSAEPTAPLPPPVQTQDLPPPPGTRYAPTLAPPGS
jgi:hypothetical protein